MVNIDVVILSYAKDEKLRSLTNQTIETLINSEDEQDFKFRILVIESNKLIAPYQYPHSTTIYPKEEFGFHKYLNIGIKNTSSDFICFCNNDLVFQKGWATSIISSINSDKELMSLCPYCPNFHTNKLEQLPNNINYGYTNGIHFTGWCFFVKRKIFNTIGLFDEHFKFWFCDDDFRLTLQKHNLKNALIRNSIVTHLASETLSAVPSRKKLYLKYIGFAYYKYKWQHHNFILYAFETIKYKIKILLNR